MIASLTWLVGILAICGSIGVGLLAISVVATHTLGRLRLSSADRRGREKTEERIGRIRLDRMEEVENVYELRAYPVPVNLDLDLESMEALYELSGLVRVYGDKAYVSMVTGRIRGPALRDFKKALLELGVLSFEWERRNHHKRRKVVKVL